MPSPIFPAGIVEAVGEEDSPHVVPENIRRLAGGIQPPQSYFSGIRIAEAMVPDNIIAFHHAQVANFKSSDVSNNYHHRFELLVVLERGGGIRIGDNKYRIATGEAFLVFPNQFHLYSGIGGESQGWLFFTFELHGRDEVQTLRDSPRKLDAAAFACLDRLLDACVRPQPDGLVVACRLAEMLRALLGCGQIPPARCNLRLEEDRREVIMERINSFVRENLKKTITISDLADSLGYSVSYIRAVFRQRLGVSLGRYIRESRLSEAAQLLQEPAIKVTDVAERCGFDSLVGFSRAFKTAFGISPKEYSRMVCRTHWLNG